VNTNTNTNTNTTMNQNTGNPSFTITIRGEETTFVSSFATLAEAYARLAAVEAKRAIPSEFAASLMAAARARRLSPSQVAWLHRLASETIQIKVATPIGDKVEGVNLTGVLGLLGNAKAAGKRFPKITMPVEGIGEVSFSLYDGRPPVVALIARGRWPNRVVLARVTADGGVHATRDWTVEVQAATRAVADNPVAALALHGVATGCCCFCARDLTTAESRSAGYGPICAERFGLPWGSTAAADAADAEARVLLQQAVEQDLSGEVLDNS
jgi:hypothetical protein